MKSGVERGPHSAGLSTTPCWMSIRRRIGGSWVVGMVFCSRRDSRSQGTQRKDSHILDVTEKYPADADPADLQWDVIIRGAR